jgi:hypothetical protein
MKFFDQEFWALQFAYLLTIALCSLQWPLYFEDRSVKVQKSIPSLDPKPQPDESIEVTVWSSRKANGLTRYHFKNKQIYFEVWAKDQPTAIKKFRREFGRAAY